jgi:hypothetical protein
MSADQVSVNGVRVGERRDSDRREITLPSGARAMVRRGRGRDLMRAQRAAAASDSSAVAFALIAELAEIDGRIIVYEDVLEMDLGDVVALQEEILGENFGLPPLRDSQGSFASDSH